MIFPSRNQLIRDLSLTRTDQMEIWVHITRYNGGLFYERSGPGPLHSSFLTRHRMRLAALTPLRNEVVLKGRFRADPCNKAVHGQLHDR